MKRYQMLIGGEWVDAEGGETFETDNPYLGAPWALVPRGKSADVDRAVEAARKAFRAPDWGGISASARGALMRRLADLRAKARHDVDDARGEAGLLEQTAKFER